MNHLTYMQMALKLSEKARLHSPPNPWVGCVVVKQGQVIGRGYTSPPGQAHAEIMALNEAQENASGATLYVTLEPCNHFGKTPPCTDAIIKAGIQEVFISIADPDPLVQGQGIEKLQSAGLKVHVGLGAEETNVLLAPYLYHRLTGKPYTVLKAAISLDGKMAAQDGSSRWISSPTARQNAHKLRSFSQGILVGSNTAVYDQPQLTARQPGVILESQPLRIILDSSGKTPPKGPLFDISLASTLILTTNKTPIERIKAWKETGVDVEVMPTYKDKLDLLETWKYLGQLGIIQLLVEGGAHLHSTLIQKNIFNELVLYVGPLLLGQNGLPFYGQDVSTLGEAPHLKLQGTQIFEDTVKLHYTNLNF